MHERAVIDAVPLVNRRNLLSALTIVLVFLLLPSLSATQDADSRGEWLPLATIGMDDNGGLVNWQAGERDGGHFDLIEIGEKLLFLQLFIGGQDVSDQIIWRRSESDPRLLGEFVGRHAGLALEVRRRYRPGIKPGTIIHEMSVTGSSESFVQKIEALITVQPKLRRHAPNDGSLGDYFYGYNKVLATSPTNKDEFELVKEAREATEVALLARHMAIVISTESVRDDVLVADPDAGARLTIHNLDGSVAHRLILGALELKSDTVGGTKYHELLYSEMSRPMRNIARVIEGTLEAIVATIGSTGGAIIVFALLLRTLLLPLGLWSIRQQRQFTDIQRRMKPRLEEINKTLKGAEKSEEMFKTYKDFGISPFSGLKGSLGLFIQLPILIALFAVTTESAIFRDVSFLWISDLSLPDHTIQLTLAVPGVGRYLNFLPFLLGVICVAAALIQSRSAGPGVESSPRSGLILALIFVIFFYPCAAALVLYWIVVNTSQIFEGLYVSRSKRSSKA
jgi:YidC/Oxa1 family membrane protein insertase